MPVVEEEVEKLAIIEGFLPSAVNIVDQQEGPLPSSVVLDDVFENC